jgi:hypothetical protein
MEPALQYMRMILYHQCITNFLQVYSETFFQYTNLRQFLIIANWEMEATFDPKLKSSTSWTVYSFL